MENASKALLIAAAVLIVIIIIAVGMKIYSSSQGTQKVATDTGMAISDKTGEATGLAISEINNGVGPWKQNRTTITNPITNQNIEVGDTINYDSKQASYTGGWGVLGVEHGKILIMSKENITSISLRGKQDYLKDGTTKLNHECAAFKNEAYADTSRSVNVDDINKITGYTPAFPIKYTYTMVNGKVKRNDQTYSSSRTKFEDINGKKLPYVDSIEVAADFYYYSLSNSLISGSKSYNLLNDNNSYWLDSPYVQSFATDVSYGFYIINRDFLSRCSYLWHSDYGAGSSSHGIRVVIVLKSNIRLSGNSTEGWTIL